MTTKILYLNDPNSASYIIKLISIIVLAIIIFVVMIRMKDGKMKDGKMKDGEKGIMIMKGGLLTILSFIIAFLYSASATTTTIANVFFALILICSTLLSGIVLLKSKTEPPKEKYEPPLRNQRNLKPQAQAQKPELPVSTQLINNLIDSKNVVLLVVYMILLIVFYTTVPTADVNKYAYAIFPITLFLGFALFFLNIYQGNNELKKMKDVSTQVSYYSVIYICLVVFITLFGIVDPGNYIKNNSGIFIFATVLSLIFGLLYLLTFLMPVFNLLRKSSLYVEPKISIPAILQFLVFLGIFITVVVGMANYPGGFFNIKTIKTSVINILLFLSIIVGFVFFISNLFSSNAVKGEMKIDETLIKVNNAFKKLLLMVFIFLILRIIVYIAYRVPEYFMNKSTFGSYLFIIVVAVLIISAIVVATAKSPALKKGVSGASSLFSPFTVAIKELISTPGNYVVLLLTIILAYILYFSTIPYVKKRFEKQGGTLLIENPITLNTETTLGTYYGLNPAFDSSGNTLNYNYAISFWVFFDAFGPNTNSSYEKYTSILNYGGNPTIWYNSRDATLKITMKRNGLYPKRSEEKGIKAKMGDDDDNIVYKRENVLLQKWNNIIINYTGGTLDIFYNGELVKSVSEVVPYLTTDTLLVGTNNGLNDGISNLVYFPNKLNSTQIFNLYNYAKDTNPPLLFNSDKTIIAQIS